MKKGTNRLQKLFVIPFFLLYISNIANAQSNHEWTFIHTDPTGKKAFLWIPNSCSSGIRALFLVTHTSIDKLLVTDSLFRVMAEKEQMAILYTRQDISCNNAAKDTSKIIASLKVFADLSGFNELNYAPWITWGHSAGTNQATAFAYWKPERTVAVLTHSGNLTRPSWTQKELPNVPFMAIKGQFEEWSVGTNTSALCGTEYEYNWVRDTVISSRKLNLIPFLGCATMRPGEGHMGFNNKLEAPLIALFIQKAIEKRVPKGIYASNGFIALKPISENTGWLTETALQTKYNTLQIDSFPNISNPKAYYWHLDKEMALAWYVFQKEVTKITTQLNGRTNPPKTIPAISFSFGLNGTNDCGLNFAGNNVDMSKKYTFSNLVSSSGLPVKLFAQDGVAYMVNDTVMGVNPCVFDLNNKTRLLMRQESNSTYQMRDRQIVLTIVKKTSGTQQAVSFNTVPACSPGDTISFVVTNTSGLPPELLIFSGPGVLLSGNKIAVLPFISKTGTTSIVLRAAHPGNTTFASSNIAEISIVVNTVLPNAPSSISGPSMVIAPVNNNTYSVSSINNATSYVWSVPTNAVIVGGQGTNTITVNYLSGFTGGAISVKGVNANGQGSASYKEVGLVTSLNNASPNELESIQIYPNPSNGIVHFKGIVESAEISVHSISGVLIIKRQIEENGMLDLNGNKGLFVVGVRTKEALNRIKLLIINP